MAAAAAAATLGLLAGCGDKGSDKKAATQVAAKVNSGEISVHQINFLLQQQQRPIAPEQLDAASRQVLERLIDQEIAVQKAMDAKLDRDPRIVSALEAAKREVLARAWLERQGEGLDRPTAQDIDKYYADKPALFAKRRVYTFDEFVIQAPPQAMTTLQSTLNNARSPQAFADALKAARLPFSTTTTTRPAENIPLELLDKVAAMNEGQTLLVPQPGGARAMVLVRAQSAPVTLEQVRPAIEQYLHNDARRKRIEAAAKSLRSGAEIKYVGKFAEAASPPTAEAAPAPLLPASDAVPTATQGTAPAAPKPAAPAPLDSDAVRKGLKLK